MRDWSPERVAEAAGRAARRAAAGDGRAARARSIDSRDGRAQATCSSACRASSVDGGALRRAGARRRRVGRARRARARRAALDRRTRRVLAADDPLAALQRLATAWRRALGAQVVGDHRLDRQDVDQGPARRDAAPHRRTVATPQNLNTEIGLPLTVLGAPADTEVLVLEMAMRGAGQIAELAAIAEPDVGRDRLRRPRAPRAARHGRGRRRGQGRAVARPARRAARRSSPPASRCSSRPAPTTSTIVTFGPGGDVGDARRHRVPFDSAHMRSNALAALAAARAVGRRAARARSTSSCRPAAASGSSSPTGRVLVDDCYNANPMSMRAALDELSRAPGRRVAVLGDMLELGPDELRFHEEVGAYAARARGRARHGRAAARREWRGDHAVADAARGRGARRAGWSSPGDTILVKASRGVGPRGGRRGARPSADGRGPHRAARPRCSSASSCRRSSSRSCATASSASTSARRGPRATTPRRARRRWAGSSSSSPSRCRS